MKGLLFAKVLELGGSKLEIRVSHTRAMQRSKRIRCIGGHEHRVRIDVIYKGRLDHELDKRIRTAFGGRADGSGFYFGRGGLRDISKTFKIPNHARLAVERLRKIRPRLDIRIFEEMPEQHGVMIVVGPKRRR